MATVREMELKGLELESFPELRRGVGGACTQCRLDVASDIGTDVARAISDVSEQGTQIPRANVLEEKTDNK